MLNLKYKDIPQLREQLWKEQGKICWLCKQDLLYSEAVLDHSHNSGHIRAVIHKGCNAFLGHIENNRKRNNITTTKLESIVQNLIYYIQTEREEIHPLHTKVKRKKKILKTLKPLKPIKK